MKKTREKEKKEGRKKERREGRMMFGFHAGSGAPSL
jgi:hypothetical protein